MEVPGVSKTLRILLAAGVFGFLSTAARADGQGSGCNGESAACANCSGCCTSECGLGDSGLGGCGGDGSGYCGPAPCCGDPAWNITAGAVFLSRSGPTPQQIIHPIGSTATVSDAADFSFDNSTGPEITIDRTFANGNSLELRYFGAGLGFRGELRRGRQHSNRLDREFRSDRADRDRRHSLEQRGAQLVASGDRSRHVSGRRAVARSLAMICNITSISRRSRSTTTGTRRIASTAGSSAANSPCGI